jgi:hypothetical protein
MAKSVTYVSGTECHLFLGPFINWLRDWFEGSGLDYFRIILVVVAPFVRELKIAQLTNIDNWKWTVNPGKAMNWHGCYANFRTSL